MIKTAQDVTQRISVPTPDGHPLSFLWDRPDSPDAIPCIIFIHGGGWDSCSADLYTRHMREIVRRGSAAASVEYTLKTRGVPISLLIEDCAACVRYIRANAVMLGINPGKICVAGESAGGHLALCLGTPGIVPDVGARPDLIVNINGVVDMTGIFCDRFYTDEEMRSSATAGEWLSKYREEEFYSPIYRVSENNSPVIHFQGLADPVVHPAETLRYHEELVRHGVVSELVLLPGQTHAFILFDYNNPDEVVEKILEQICDRLAGNGYLRD